MNTHNLKTKLFLLLTALVIGTGAGFANSETHLASAAGNSSLLAYSNITPGTTHFSRLRDKQSTERRQANSQRTVSCSRVTHMSKPISVYRNRYCTADSTPANNLAQRQTKRLVF